MGILFFFLFVLDVGGLFYFLSCLLFVLCLLLVLFLWGFLFVFVLVVLFSVAMGYVISEKTLAAWWIPVGVALAAGMLTLPLYRKWIWLTTMENRIVNVLCHLVCVGSVCYVLFLAGNYLSADAASEHEVTVTVLDKRMEQHEKRRRVGKHRYVSDGMRYEYYLEVAFDNGKVETLHVSRAVYRKARKGKPKVLSLIRGGFGLPVIKKGI